MDNTLGQAIYCDCYIPEYKRYKILGSITDLGLIEIVRPHKNKTIIHAQELMLECIECGYKRFIKIKENEAVNQPIYETKSIKQLQ